jgi:hypothetical protein
MEENSAWDEQGNHPLEFLLFYWKKLGDQRIF